ncbi:c-type cytochrome [Alcaligenes sp. SDU_A2]|uniref:c-type cytochrome n=1 Tax=Alcaligenes sp. SDU_A2 TaxID=3136634 RepID=UPI002C64D2FC|nr:c-type cytochrome [Alcaligenes faecalis]
MKRYVSFIFLAASFCTGLPALAQNAPAVQANPQAAHDKISMCIGCHGLPGYKASFPEVYHVPKIAGQGAAYIQAALKEYASGARSFPTMQAIAQSLSEQDMADIAAYYAGIKP